MTISDETLMAYLDNELPADERERVNAALAADPALQARLKRQERVHAMLSSAFNPALKQPVPERIIETAMKTPASLPTTNWRERIAGLFSLRPAAPQVAAAGAFALVLVVGLVIYAGPDRSPNSAPFIAEGQLAHALETQLASDEAVAGPRVGVSFRAQGGEVCRTFDMGSARENFAGIACRGESAWTVKTFVSAPDRRPGPYGLASAGLPAAVRDAVAGMIDGGPFDADAERRARDGGWR